MPVRWSSLGTATRVVVAAAAMVVAGALGFGGSWLLHAQSGKTLSAQDFVDIQALYARYNWALDTGDIDAWAATFTPDGAFNANVGREAVLKFGHSWHDGRGSHLKHWNANLVVTPTADGASGQAYLALVDFQTKPPSLAGSSTYADQLVRTPQGWRFKKRQTKGDVAPQP